MIESNREIFRIEGLSVDFATRKGLVRAVRGVSFAIRPAESFALIGESGSGKTTIAFASLNYLAANAQVASGRVLFHGEDLRRKRPAELQSIWGCRMSMVYQDPHTSLNPAYTVGEQLIETIRQHRRIAAKEAWDLAESALRAVLLPDVGRTMHQYPHQLSGGQKQRVVIAMALSCQPELIILDEPTTALDVTTELCFLDLLADLRKRFQTALFYITHDLGIVARIADTIGVIYAGELVELGSREDVFLRPAHPYTRALMRSIPSIWTQERRKLISMPGRIPSLIHLPTGCIFHERCEYVEAECLEGRIALTNVDPGHTAACRRWKDLTPLDLKEAARELMPPPAEEAAIQLQALDIRSYYQYRPSLLSRLTGRKKQIIRAVDGISFEIKPGQTFGLVGESGCGKSTIGRALVRLQDLAGGRITFQGQDILGVSAKDKRFRQQLQIIFQNPDSSLNPRHKVKSILGRPLRLFNLAGTEAEVRQRCLELLDMVRLGPEYIHRFPHEMSGGEKQRVAIARAFATRPVFVVCDEVTSALDVSVQASIVNLLVDLQREFGTAYLFISHDLNIVRQISDRIGVMYLGRFVELGTVRDVFLPPYHPYTRALLSAVSVPSLEQTHQKVRLEGVIPSAADIPRGCRFHTRCPQLFGSICSQEEPLFREVRSGHFLACHIPVEQLAKMEPVFG